MMMNFIVNMLKTLAGMPEKVVTTIIQSVERIVTFATAAASNIFHHLMDTLERIVRGQGEPPNGNAHHYGAPYNQVHANHLIQEATRSAANLANHELIDLNNGLRQTADVVAATANAVNDEMVRRNLSAPAVAHP